MTQILADHAVSLKINASCGIRILVGFSHILARIDLKIGVFATWAVLTTSCLNLDKTLLANHFVAALGNFSRIFQLKAYHAIGLHIGLHLDAQKMIKNDQNKYKFYL